ncbi:alpha/beta-hydrolase [Delitschia confertaspora ATCC 74209]|uniref:Alpha/beta-hydrolase n=1 Tax=Delitschia confertaspora ATCC 74209 TaxID=1513339 RepID=A0A9P4JJZ2_9PLEO|nr:alpha/beta-hydrolase [Delitschia confertaspora ATCC 74209]
MIDHVLGRPSVKFRKIQVFAVVSFWSYYLYRGDRHGPPLLRRLSAFLSRRLTTWQTLVITLLWLYVARNFGKLVGLECPEPLANLYSRSYFRATWVTTALDAGFWSAMRIRRKWLRDLLSMVFSVYYMVCAEQADEKVRKVRGMLTVDHLRVSWNKGTTPYLSAITSIMRPRLMRYPPRAIRIPRPAESSYKEPVHAWLYFNGPISALKKHDKLVLDIPGGGFVAMDPRNHDDKLMGWAAKTGVPVLSLDYKKAPEFPYPYALNECYDVYHTIIASRGRCVGMSGEYEPKIVVSGDSAGGNLAVGMVLMILQSGSTDTRRWQGERELPSPVGLILIYPALDMNIGNWMTDEQMALIRDRRVRKTNQGILRRKSDDYRHLAPNTPHVSDDEDSNDEAANPPSYPDSPRSTRLGSSILTSPQTMIRLSAAHTGKDTTNGTTAFSKGSDAAKTTASAAATIDAPAPPATQLRTRLAMSSMISYFNDRILTPEMMRAMIILYIGPHNRPDFSTDFLLSPLLAPEALLAKFPKTWMLTGERDPLVDDTVIFAGRLRQAKRAEWVFGREMGLSWTRGKKEWREEDAVVVELVPGISHGFLQFVGVFPEGWKYITQCSRWMSEAFDMAEEEKEKEKRNWNGNGNGAALSSKANGGTGKKHTNEASDYFGPHANANGHTDRSASIIGLADAVKGLSSTGQRRRGSIQNGSLRHRRSGTASSADPDDDLPLEMSVARPKIPSPTTNGTAMQSFRAIDTNRGRRRGKRDDNRRRRSLVSLGSEDDLLGRRMKGFAAGLMGNGIEEVLPTP